MTKNIPLNKKYELTVADAADSKAIKNLFESIDYPLSIDIQFRRGDDPYRSFIEEDDGATVVLVREIETQKVIGMGACSCHKIWLNGEKKRGAYLNSLKLLPEHRRISTILPKAFKVMFDLTRNETDIYYATILEQATSTRKMFEKKRSYMPEYTKQEPYTTFFFSPSGKTYGMELEKGTVAGLDEFYEERLKNYNLAPLSRKINGIKDEDFIVWRKNGKILASCAVLNNQHNKNYYLNGYNGILKYLSHLPINFFGYPKPPKAGKTVNNASLSMLLFDESVTVKERAKFIKAASSYAQKYDFLMVGLAKNDISYEAFNKIRHIKYSSIIYTINENLPKNITGRPIYSDVAFM